MMDRRTFLEVVGTAAATSSILPISGQESTDENIIARSRDRRVRYLSPRDNDDPRVTWVIENRHSGDTVYTIDVPAEPVAHSYASSHHVFVVIDLDDVRKTIDWELQTDVGRVRTVERDGTTRIVDYHASGFTQRRQ